MDLKLNFNKSLYLLQAGRMEEAVLLLTELRNQAFLQEHAIYQVRIATVLGEYFAEAGDASQAKSYLLEALSVVLDEDQEAIVGKELLRAEHMLAGLPT